MDNVRAILQEIGEKLSSEFEVFEFKDISYGRQFKIKIEGTTLNFRVFYNKKGSIKYDYSTITDNRILSKLQRCLEGDTNLMNESIVEQSQLVIQKDKYETAIGTDESGKGDYFGPLVVAGVYVNLNTKGPLEQIGVRDSKKIGDTKILELAQRIKTICNGHFSIIEITPITYNNLYSTFKNEGKNLNTLLAWGHAKAIEEVLSKVECNLAISDKFANEKYILSKLQEKGRGIELIQEHKAESYTAVATASILARARFLERMKKMSEEYSIDFAKGASTKVVSQAKEFVNKNGKKELANVAKLHFKTTDQVLN